MMDHKRAVVYALSLKYPKYVDKSTFPPDMTAPTRFPLNLLSFIIAANDNAPDN